MIGSPTVTHACVCNRLETHAYVHSPIAQYRIGIAAQRRVSLASKKLGQNAFVFQMTYQRLQCGNFQEKYVYCVYIIDVIHVDCLGGTGSETENRAAETIIIQKDKKKSRTNCDAAVDDCYAFGI